METSGGSSRNAKRKSGHREEQPERHPFNNAIVPPHLQTIRHSESAALALLCEKSFSTDSLGVLTSVTQWVTLQAVIRSFRHKGLQRFFRTGSTAGIQAAHANRLRLILGRLDASTSPRDMDLPGLGLHPLKGPRKAFWAVRVSGNWRVTFTFAGTDADAVDYEDYH